MSALWRRFVRFFRHDSAADYWKQRALAAEADAHIERDLRRGLLAALRVMDRAYSDALMDRDLTRAKYNPARHDRYHRMNDQGVFEEVAA